MDRPRQLPRSTSARTLDMSFRITAKPVAEVGTQTVLTDSKPLGELLPPIPDTATELEICLVYVCNALDTLGRKRQAAKDKLDENRRDRTKLERERKERRKLETEIRRLHKEVGELKDFNKHFSDINM